MALVCDATSGVDSRCYAALGAAIRYGCCFCLYVNASSQKRLVIVAGSVDAAWPHRHRDLDAVSSC